MYVLVMPLRGSSRRTEEGGVAVATRSSKVLFPTVTELKLIEAATQTQESPHAESSTNINVAPASTDNFEDLKLLHYYTYELAHTLSLPGAIGRTWSDGVPRLAFDEDHAYLVHALLAAAAAHKVSKNPNDTQSYLRGQSHYNQSIGLMKSLHLETLESNTAAALATVMLLIWYESLYGCWENGLLVHH